MHFFGDWPKRPVEFSLKLKPFRARGPAEIRVKVSHFSTDVVLKFKGVSLGKV